MHKVLKNHGNQLEQDHPGKNALANKVQELVEIIGKSVVDNNTSRSYQKQIEEAFRKSEEAQKKLEPFRTLDHDNSLSREELLDGLEKLLAENQIDSRIGSNYLKKNTLQKIVMLILAVLLIVAGLSMIIMPAPPSFEIFTVFYFNINDGVTVMDLISLMIIFGGVLLLVQNFNKK